MIEIAQDSLIVFDRFGIQLDFIEEKIESSLEQISTTIHSELTDAEIFSDDEGSEDWMKNGHTCRVLEPGKNWKTGRLRFRIVTEFISDVTEEPEIPSQKPNQIDKSDLDAIRNSIEPN